MQQKRRNLDGGNHAANVGLPEALGVRQATAGGVGDLLVLDAPGETALVSGQRGVDPPRPVAVERSTGQPVRLLQLGVRPAPGNLV